MQFGGVTVLFKLRGDELAGTMDMGEFIVKDGFESLVNRFVDAAGVPKPDGRGDVLRLDMEGRRMGNPKLDGDFFSFDREGKGMRKCTTSAQRTASSSVVLLGRAKHMP